MAERPAKVRRISGLDDVTGKSPSPTPTTTMPEESDAASNLVDAEALPLQGNGEQEIDSKIPAVEGESSTPVPTLSKKQQKRLAKQERWASTKKERRAEEKARKKEKKYAAWKAATENGEVNPFPAKEKVAQKPVPVTILLDCDFDDLMHEREIVSLSSQITRSYSENSKAPFPAHLMISSFGGKLKERFEVTLTGQYKRWKNIRFLEENFVDVSKQADKIMREKSYDLKNTQYENVEGPQEGPPQIVYLTADSDDSITKLDPYTTYIVGGIIDKNRHKGICYKRAMEAGVKTAKLPIGEYMKMNSRFVLTTNQVVEILLKWFEKGDWAEAFMAVMPKRKGGVLKESPGDAEGIEAEVPPDSQLDEAAGEEAPNVVQDPPQVEAEEPAVQEAP